MATQDTAQARPEPVAAMLDKLMTVVDSVSTKIGSIESLLSMEGVVKNSIDSDCFVSEIQLPTGEPLFGATGGAKPKIRKLKGVGSDFETLESDVEVKQRKKKHDKKPTHAIETIPQEYTQRLSKHTDKTLIEKKTDAHRDNDPGQCRPAVPERGRRIGEHWPRYSTRASHSVLDG